MNIIGNLKNQVSSIGLLFMIFINNLIITWCVLVYITLDFQL